MEKKNKMLDAALSYAERGWAVFPCIPRDKKPATAHGFKDATKDQGKIKQWWYENPDYNVAIATGSMSGGLTVLDFDIDPEKGIDGLEVLRKYERDHGELPETVRAITGRGGYHFFYYSKDSYTSKAGIYEGVDIRADGGYIVAPPSLHPNGNRYEFEAGYEPGEIDIAKNYDKVRQFIAGSDYNKSKAPAQKSRSHAAEVIPEGARVTTLVSLMGSLRSKGLTDEAIRAAVEAENNLKCKPPLSDKELEKEVYAALSRNWEIDRPYFKQSQESQSLQPADYTDVGQAQVFVREYGAIARYSSATKWIVYNGVYWEESENKARALSQKLTDRQLKDSRRLIKEARILVDKAVESDDKEAERSANEALKAAKDYRGFVLSMRKSNRISAVLTEAAPSLEIRVEQLDADGFLLNCPGGTIDLRTGIMREHRADDYCTKCCACDPSKDNMNIWLDFLDKMTCGDKDLARYHQIISGQEAIGKIFCENMEMQIGSGGNGKSTYNNSKHNVLGNYAGSLSAETLTANNRSNKKPEYAELRGKRFIIASELEEGCRLDTAILKKLCSTDNIYAEKKFKDPFSFRPSHTICLFTNHLPRVGTSDKGTWSRIIVMPFNADFRGQHGEIKNYADYLFSHCGGAILQWIVDGAKAFIDANYIVEPPESVKVAISEYKNDNDQIAGFLEECCEVDRTYNEKAGSLYEAYRSYCERLGEPFTRNRLDFKTALLSAGYEWKKTKTGALYYGLQLNFHYAVKQL